MHNETVRLRTVIGLLVVQEANDKYFFSVSTAPEILFHPL